MSNAETGLIDCGIPEICQEFASRSTSTMPIASAGICFAKLRERCLNWLELELWFSAGIELFEI
ncbi:hypothetical protein APA_1770 [Pseudanabaena sp. lw0831]|nr:hypothetical protein APA_1770 [Pseudanabaena sp. lw0831]